MMTREEIQAAKDYREMQGTEPEEEGTGLDGLEEYTRAECEALMARMDAYEAEVKAYLDSQVKVFTSEEYSQEFLRSLIPGAK